MWCELLMHHGLLFLLLVCQLFLPLGSVGSNLVGVSSNQFVFPCILLVLYAGQLPLELGPHLSDHLQLLQSCAEVKSFVCL